MSAASHQPTYNYVLDGKAVLYLASSQTPSIREFSLLAPGSAAAGSPEADRHGGRRGRQPMKTRSLVLVGALSAVLIAPAGALFAQQTDASAKRRVIVLVWDGLRADDL